MFPVFIAVLLLLALIRMVFSRTNERSVAFFRNAVGMVVRLFAICDDVFVGVAVLEESETL